MTLELRTASLSETHAVAAAVAGLSRAGDIIVLSGEMGSGKTAFAQGFGRALGIDEPITSPTFTLIHSYDIGHGTNAGKLTLHHADLYRLERMSEVADLALAELAEFRGIVLVEWGDVVESVFGDHLVVHLESDVGDDDLDDDSGLGATSETAAPDVDPDEPSTSRRIEIAGVGPAWAGRWDRLRAALETFRC